MGLNRRGENERGFSMMLGRIFDPRDTGLLLTVVYGPDGRPAAMCQFVPSQAIDGFSLDLMRRDPAEHPNGLLDFALCSTIQHLKELGQKGLSLNFAALRSTLDGETGDGIAQRVERWALRRMSGVLQIETLWKFNAKYDPDWLPRYIVYDSPEQFAPATVAILRAESLTEVPVVGRLLTTGVAKRSVRASRAVLGASGRRRRHRAPGIRAGPARPVTVYVDDWRQRATVGPVDGVWSHMVGDDEEELHALAERLGLRRAWYQRHRRHRALDHYDVTEPLREEAIALGAVR